MTISHTIKNIPDNYIVVGNLGKRSEDSIILGACAVVFLLPYFMGFLQTSFFI